VDRDHPRTSFIQILFIPSNGSEEDFKRFPIFNQHENNYLGGHLGLQTRLQHNLGRGLSKECKNQQKTEGKGWQKIT